MIDIIKKVISIKLIRYLINGTILFIIDYIVFYILKVNFNINIEICQMISRSISASFGFFSHKFIVFKNDEKNPAKVGFQGFLFISLVISNIFISAFLVYSFYNYFLITNLFILKVITEIIVVTESFLLLNFVIFKMKKTNSI